MPQDSVPRMLSFSRPAWVFKGLLTQAPCGLAWSGDPNCFFHCLSAWDSCLERPWRACRIWLCLPSISSRS